MSYLIGKDKILSEPNDSKAGSLPNSKFQVANFSVELPMTICQSAWF